MIKWRINLVFVLIILIGTAIVSRLIYLQLINYEFYRALAQGQQNKFQPLLGERGKIYLRGGEILATNSSGNHIFLEPSKIQDKEKTAEVLASILNLEKDIILKKIEKISSSQYLKTALTKSQQKAIENSGLPGVSVAPSSFRQYPQAAFASQVVGFVGGEGEGQYGLEGYYNSRLLGKEVFQESEDGFGAGSGFSQDSGNGEDFFLTLDYNIQFMAEKQLAEARENLKIEGGQIIVLEPATGAILALANYPNFDPNNYSDADDFGIFQNGALQKFFEPGSVLKPITMSAALEEGKLNPDTTYIDEGFVKIGDDIIYNNGRRTWGQRTMTEVFEKSINTGAIFAEKQIGHKKFLEYLERFGFFEPTGIDLQGEVFSSNKELKKGYEVNFATASFGQGIEITPLQLARAFSAIANGGRAEKPYIVDRILENGTITKTPTDTETKAKIVISQKTASQLTAMLVSVVELGSGKLAKVPGYYIAGKTGTAQMSWASLGIAKKGYSDKAWHSFIGFAPAFDAKFLILIKLDNPRANASEYSAAPIFQNLAEYIINYLQIPPDYPKE